MLDTTNYIVILDTETPNQKFDRKLRQGNTQFIFSIQISKNGVLQTLSDKAKASFYITYFNPIGTVKYTVAPQNANISQNVISIPGSISMVNNNGDAALTVEVDDNGTFYTCSMMYYVQQNYAFNPQNLTIPAEVNDIVKNFKTIDSNEILIKNPDGSIQGSGIKLQGDKYFFPKSASFPSDSVDIGPATTISEVGGWLEYEANTLGNKYILLGYLNSLSGSEKPIYWEHKAEEKNVVINPTSNVVMNNVTTLTHIPTQDSQINGIYLSFNDDVSNLRIKATSLLTNEVIKYIPDEASYRNGVGGLNLTSGVRNVLSQSSPISALTSYSLKFDFIADKPINLKGDGIKPYLAVDRQLVTAKPIALEEEIGGSGGTPVVGNYAKLDGSNVDTTFANIVLNKSDSDSFNQKVLNAAAIRTISKKIDDTHANIEGIFKSNYYETSVPLDISTLSGEGITIMYQFNSSNSTITQKLPPSNNGKLIIIGISHRKEYTNCKLIVQPADGEAINGSNNPITLDQVGVSGLMLPYDNLSGYEYFSTSEMANDKIAFYDTGNNKQIADYIVAGTGVKLDEVNGNLEISTSSLSLDDGFLAANEEITSLTDGESIAFDNVYFGSNLIKTNSIVGFNIDLVGTSMGEGFIEIGVYNGNNVLTDNNNQPMVSRKDLTQLQELGTISKMFYMETSTDITPTVKVKFTINGQNTVHVFNRSVFVIQDIKNSSKAGIPLLGYSQLTGYDLKYSIDKLTELYNLEQLKSEATGNPVEIAAGTQYKFRDDTIGNFITSGKYAISNNELAFFVDVPGLKVSFNKIFDEYESNIMIGKNVTATIEYVTAIAQDDLKMALVKWTGSTKPTEKIVSDIQDGSAIYESNWVEISSINLPNSINMQPVSLNATVPSDSKRVALVIYNKNGNIASRIEIKKLNLSIPDITLFKYDYITPNVPVGITVIKGGSSQIGTTEIDFSNNEVIFDNLKSKVSIGEDASKANVTLDNIKTDDLAAQMNKVTAYWNKANNTLDNVLPSDFNRVLKRTGAYKELANRKSISMDDIKSEFENHAYDFDTSKDLSTVDGNYIIVTYAGKENNKISQVLPPTDLDKTIIMYFQKEDEGNSSTLEITAPNGKKINGSFDPIIVDSSKFVGVFLPIVSGDYEFIHETQVQQTSIVAVATDGTSFPMNQLSTDGSLELVRGTNNTATIKGIQFSPSYYARYSTPKLLNDGFVKSDTVEYYKAILRPDKEIKDRLDDLLKANVTYLVCGRIAPMGKAKIAGYITISIIDLASGDVVNDVDSEPCIFRRNYIVGQKLDFVEVASIIKMDKNTNIGCKVEYYFGTELISTGTITEGITGILIHDLSQEKSVGLMEYELDTMQNILWSKHDFTTQIADFSQHTKNNEPLVVIKALNGNRDTDGWGVEGTTDFNYSVSNGVMTLSNIGSDSNFGISYVFSAEDTRILKNKDVKARIILDTNSNDWITEFVGWKGSPDNYTSKIMIGMNGDTVQLSDGWSEIPSSLTTMLSTETNSLALIYGVPSDITNLAFIIRSKAQTGAQFLNVKSIVLSTAQPGIYYSLYAPELESELHFYQDDKIARGYVNEDYTIKVGTDYNFLPFGKHSEGDANVEFFKAPWASIYDNKDFNTNLKFENDGNAEIDVNIMFKLSAGSSEKTTVAFAKLTSGTGENVSDYTILPDAEFSFDFNPQDGVYWQKIPNLKIQVEAGEQICLLAKTTNNDKVIVNARVQDNHAVLTRVDFYEFTPSSPDMAAMTTKINELEQQISSIPIEAIQKILARIQITDDAYSSNTFLKLDNKPDGSAPKVEAIVIGSVPSASPPVAPIEPKNNSGWKW